MYMYFSTYIDQSDNACYWKKKKKQKQIIMVMKEKMALIMLYGDDL